MGARNPALGAAGAVFTALSSLYREPYSLSDDEIESVLLTIRQLDAFVRREAALLAKAGPLSETEAHQALLAGTKPFPSLNRCVAIPGVRDVAASIRPWMIYIEDEEHDRAEVKSIFAERGIAIEVVEEEDIFLRELDKKPFWQYWIDLGLGATGDVRRGKKLLNRTRLSDKSEIVVYTQHSEAAFLRAPRMAARLTSVVDKSDLHVKSKMRAIADRLGKRLEHNLGVDLQNPLLACWSSRSCFSGLRPVATET